MAALLYLFCSPLSAVNSAQVGCFARASNEKDIPSSLIDELKISKGISDTFYLMAQTDKELFISNTLDKKTRGAIIQIDRTLIKAVLLKPHVK